MKNSSGWRAARGQIAWILGLLISTAIVIQLELIDLGPKSMVLDTNSMAQNETIWSQALLQARSRATDPRTASSQDQVALLLALSLTALESERIREMLQAEALGVINALGNIADPDPLLTEAVALTRQIFRLQNS